MRGWPYPLILYWGGAGLDKCVPPPACCLLDAVHAAFCSYWLFLWRSRIICRIDTHRGCTKAATAHSSCAWARWYADARQADVLGVKETRASYFPCTSRAAHRAAVDCFVCLAPPHSDRTHNRSTIGEAFVGANLLRRAATFSRTGWMPLQTGSRITPSGAASTRSPRRAAFDRAYPHPCRSCSPASSAADSTWRSSLACGLASGAGTVWQQQAIRQACRQAHQRLHGITCCAQSSKSQAAAVTEDAERRAEARQLRQAASTRNHRITMVRSLGCDSTAMHQ